MIGNEENILDMEEVILKNGKVAKGYAYREHDDESLAMTFWKYFSLVKDVKKYGENPRGVNIPEVLSEGLVCLDFDMVRTSECRNAGSYDCVKRGTGEGIQVKATVMFEEDVSSFGPRSKWDRLLFVDFCPNEEPDGNVAYYEIDSSLFENKVLNKRAGETFRDQQLAGRRPRLSLKDVIKENNIQPLKTRYLLLSQNIYQLTKLRFI